MKTLIRLSLLFSLMLLAEDNSTPSEVDVYLPQEGGGYIKVKGIPVDNNSEIDYAGDSSTAPNTESKIQWGDSHLKKNAPNSFPVPENFGKALTLLLKRFDYYKRAVKDQNIDAAARHLKDLNDTLRLFDSNTLSGGGRAFWRQYSSDLYRMLQHHNYISTADDQEKMLLKLEPVFKQIAERFRF